ncbi:MAG: peptidoglycan-binding domain-containing protein, partial [Pseudomonadota bacterium]
MPSLPAEWLDRRLSYRLPMLRGWDVRIVQLRLGAMGYLPVDSADGLYGPATRNAVRIFQADQELTVDGVVGEETMAALMTAAGRAAREVKPPPRFGPRRRPERPTERAPALPRTPEVPVISVVPPDWLVPARVRRVVVHWTGGNQRASSEDREHYHILIEGDGTVVRGRHPIDANDKTGDGVYAA